LDLFAVAQHPPSVTQGAPKLALDALPDIGWASNLSMAGNLNWIVSAYAEGLTFLGYPELSVLAQRAEYRKISERLATEMTRNWITFESTGDEDEGAQDDRAKKIETLNAEFDRLKVRDHFRFAAQNDGFFGRSHIFLDFGVKLDDRDELLQPVVDGAGKLSKAKIGKGLQRLQSVEAVWTYPSGYNTNDPLSEDWYNPKTWFVMGKELHRSRLLTFIGRAVPDMLKPAYSFGGLSLTQLAKPYVENWLQTRQSVNDILNSFTTWVLETDLKAQMDAGADQLDNRAQLFNLYKNNLGIMLIDKTNEGFTNVSAPLGTMDALQAQAQEHVASVANMPLVVWAGLQPAGLNASSDGEIRVWYDWIKSYQEQLFRAGLTEVFHAVQLSKFGEIDPRLSIKFVPLFALTEKEEAELEKTKADTDGVLIDHGVIDVVESRRRLAGKPGSAYASLDVNSVPDATPEEELDLAKASEAEAKAENADDPPPAQVAAKKTNGVKPGGKPDGP
jgi:uncharacterized protein